MSIQRRSIGLIRLVGSIAAMPALLLAAVTLAAAPQRGDGGPAAAGPQTQAQRPLEDAARIRELIADYAAAVSREPVDLALASRVWENSPDVSLTYPLGEVRGWAHIKRDFYENVMEARFSKRKLTPRDIDVHANRDCAWAEFSWRFVAKSRKDGSPVETSGRETQIYRKAGPRRWALVHVHYSALPPK